MVWTSDVRAAVLIAKHRMPIPLIAELGNTSERTVYRIVDGEYDRLMELGMADEILLAVDGDLSLCHVEHADGEVEYPHG